VGSVYKRVLQLSKLQLFFSFGQHLAKLLPKSKEYTIYDSRCSYRKMVIANGMAFWSWTANIFYNMQWV